MPPRSNPDESAPSGAGGEPDRPGALESANAINGLARDTRFSLPPMRYPNGYVWLVFVSAMDVMLTSAILNRGGTELNPIAAAVIDAWGLPGALVFKFSLMLFVILVCEAAGRELDRLGRGLVCVAVAVSSFPVAYSLGLLVHHELTGGA